jgi:hypothetical protein
MRFPWLQVDADFIAARAGDLGAHLGISRREAMGLALDLWTWALARAPDDAAPDGSIQATEPVASRLIATAVGWGADEAFLINGLEAVGLLVRMVGGYRLRGFGRYKTTWDKNRRRSSQLPSGVRLPPGGPLPIEQIPDGLDLGAPRVRLKTPEERAVAEARAYAESEARAKRNREAAQYRAELKTAKRASCRVYFIQQEGGDRLVKIGVTTRPVEVRLKELQAGQSYPLVILAHAPGGRYEEGRLHDRFGPLNVTGEWFRPEADLLAYAATVGKAGVL